MITVFCCCAQLVKTTSSVFLGMTTTFLGDRWLSSPRSLGAIHRDQRGQNPPRPRRSPRMPDAASCRWFISNLDVFKGGLFDRFHGTNGIDSSPFFTSPGGGVFQIFFAFSRRIPFLGFHDSLGWLLHMFQNGLVKNHQLSKSKAIVRDRGP